MTPAYTVERVHDIDLAVETILARKLFLNDYDTSHTLFLLEEHEERTRLGSPIKAAWVAKDGQGTEVGCALVCEGGMFTDGADTVSLFVDPAFRGQGIGGALLDMALETSPTAWAFHTPDAQTLYSRKGLDMAFFSRDLVDEESNQPSPSITRETKPRKARPRR